MNNLNEYMEIQSADATSYTRSDLVNAGLTKKLGLVLGESQLEEFFSGESWAVGSSHINIGFYIRLFKWWCAFWIISFDR